jgi:short-subunit dehydrogenase
MARTTRKNILITGASSGLGEGMARELAAMGRNLALCARRVDRLETLKEELLSQHPGIDVRIAALDVDDHPKVFEVFEAFARDFGSLDRIVVNAGIGNGKRIGTGHFEANARTAQTNFVSALAQCEAAVQIFRRQTYGHLVTISSVSALRGMPKHLTTYAASKAGLSALAEGIRAELLGTDIVVTTILPGYIKTEMNEKVENVPMRVDAQTGTRALVRAMEREPATAYVPGWPWAAIGAVMRRLPLRVLAKLV